MPGAERDKLIEKPTGKTIADWAVARGPTAPRRPTDNIDGLSVWKGPYGPIVAIDLKTGEPPLGHPQRRGAGKS